MAERVKSFNWPLLGAFLLEGVRIPSARLPHSPEPQVPLGEDGGDYLEVIYRRFHAQCSFIHGAALLATLMKLIVGGTISLLDIYRNFRHTVGKCFV